MFDEFSVVSTAISSFNNAALYNPLFFAIGLLALPLFIVVYIYGKDLVQKIGWAKKDTERKICFFSALILMLWLLIFGGNYAVIRDGISLLSTMIAIILFLLTVFVTKRAIALKYIEKISGKKTRWFVFGFLILAAVFSAAHTWTGILLQISAILCGMIIGSRIKKEFSDMFVVTCLFGFVTVLILMQPEYFRFGQLGNLTLVHIISLLFVGFSAITALVTKYTNARSRIYASAYIKLKWLFRILSLLALVLFVSTESVPVFIGILVVTALSEMLTIYHSTGNFQNVSKKSFALLLISFGVLIICPVITSLGILYLTEYTDKWKTTDFTGLL